jgi:hypothetical protein
MFMERKTSPEAETAVKLFSQTPKKCNCAQAVALAFGRDDLVESLQSCGGGRAEGGLCGALHAACILVHDRETLTQRFAEAVGHVHYRDILQVGKTPCTECVRIAGALAVELGLKKTE